MDKQPFRIGLCMAGAVSAGAYTAGVIDYLMEALDEWELKKRQDPKNTPSHQVLIPVLGGASAGGMTALLTATTINSENTPMVLPAPHHDGEKMSPHLLDRHPQNKLYNSWVDLIDDDMFPKLLDDSDIKAAQVISLLNSDFIKEVADKMICRSQNEWQPTPNYFETPVKIFTTLSNLQGFNYNVGFQAAGEESRYNMVIHNDYACFELFGDKQVERNSTPGWMPLNFQNDDNVQTAKNAAMATGAFPIGLRARILERNAEHVNAIPWLQNIFEDNPLPKGIVKTLNIDGGLINNEPFDKVRDVLDDIYADQILNEEIQLPPDGDANPEPGQVKAKSREDIKKEAANTNCNSDSFVNTVLMVDPFPSVDPKADFNYGIDLPNIISKTLSAMLSQMRAKPRDYAKAIKSDDVSRFIISPAREIRKGVPNTIKLNGDKAIACGSLGGFGGFLDKEFRIHDYYLGRFNCEIFLRDYFTIPQASVQNNPIFQQGYMGIDLDSFRSARHPDKIQIIPIFTPRKPDGEFPMPIFSSQTDWPKLTVAKLDRFERPIRQRIQKIVLNLSDWKCSIKVPLFFVCQTFLNKMLSRKVLKIIKDSLFESLQIDGYEPNSKTNKTKCFKLSKIWKYWGVAFGFVFIIYIVFNLDYFRIEGIMGNELADSRQTLLQIFPRGVYTRLSRNITLDYFFIAAYTTLFYYSRRLIRVLGWVSGICLLPIVLLPGIFDIVENILLLKIVGNPNVASCEYFDCFYWVVRMKWVFVVPNVLMVLLVAIKGVSARVSGKY